MHSTALILVVEDFASFREKITAIVRQLPEAPKIAVAEDGVQAVAMAEKLRPDLILLDIGLPRMNGIEAAKRILTISPQSRIIFVSQESAPEMVALARDLGVAGYVFKKDVNRDLVNAIEIVLRGREFSPLQNRELHPLRETSS